MTIVRSPEVEAPTRRSTVEVLPQALGGSPLARIALEPRTATGELAARWFAPRPGDPDAWRAAVAARPRVGGWADALAPALAARGAAAERLRRVVEGNGVLVTTGQQPGLFGGPLYTWWKALSALALADEIERCTGVPTAPLFWAATDDTDFAETARTVVAGVEGPVELVASAGGATGLMMSEMPLGDVSEQLAALERSSGSASDAAVLALARESYAGDATVGGAYLALLRALLEPLGIAVLDAAHPAVSRFAHPYLQRALDRAPEVAAAVRARDAEIVAAGLRPQVAEVAALSLVFTRAEGGKRRVPLAEAPQLALGAGPGTLSPNVLLRPVIERAILPTIAYVAGPGEIAYFAQSTAVADALVLDAPVAVPRWSGAVIEPHVRSILDEFSVDVDDLADAHAAEGRFAREATPVGASRAIAELRERLATTLGAVREATGAAGVPLPGAAIDALGRDVEHRVGRLERRLLAAVKRREADRLRRLARARGALFPLGKRQERALNLLPILARQGRGLLEDVLAHARVHARMLIG